jgi:hypothetical protein
MAAPPRNPVRTVPEKSIFSPERVGGHAPARDHLIRGVAQRDEHK